MRCHPTRGWSTTITGRRHNPSKIFCDFPSNPKREYGLGWKFSLKDETTEVNPLKCHFQHSFLWNKFSGPWIFCIFDCHFPKHGCILYNQLPSTKHRFWTYPFFSKVTPPPPALFGRKRLWVWCSKHCAVECVIQKRFFGGFFKVSFPLYPLIILTGFYANLNVTVNDFYFETIFSIQYFFFKRLRILSRIVYI